ncbi:MAG: ethanolamine permease [Kordiimonadaceae bacterium]|jgi:ethanolamine permease|nr:ethanolamine permease [Kordiimonadaceae bacterium]MBT6035883.1 ethanolamine permease [Kordiimonadaceae bacterium]MBT6330916.1 ethanolamine permease [Kordiimonadaceae bacterium]
METENNNEPSVGADYFAERELNKGAAGWILLAGLGVGYVISGDFAGWNFGLAEGGWGGLLIATLMMAVMYTAMIFSLAELSATIPAAGGGYGFARRAFGPFGGFLTGTAILLEYAVAPAAIATFISAYLDSLIGISGWTVSLAFYAVFIGIHIYGVGEALKIMFFVTILAVVALVIFIVAMVPHFNVANLFDIPVQGGIGASKFLPFGIIGIWAAIPFGMWFFLAVEGLPLAAEETADPQKNMPKGMITAILVLLVLAGLVLVLGPGGGGAANLADAGDPLIEAMRSDTAYGGPTLTGKIINIVGLAGLIASFFSIIFGYSRQVFALSRAGYLPRVLSLTSKRKTPYLALLVPGSLGFLLSLSINGDLLILIAVFGASISYILMMAAHIKLRISEPDMDRPYRTPGGILTSSIALFLAIIALSAGFLVEPSVIIYAAIFYLLMISYFLLYSRHHLVAGAPEEEFAAIRQAEATLDN